ncbi:hypothetical protein NDK25_07530 [Niallia taxi]|nr:hypothetical protein [Niallia taxi]MDE5052258.1 hypothetical protein [Niallia taxi]
MPSEEADEISQQNSKQQGLEAWLPDYGFSLLEAIQEAAVRLEDEGQADNSEQEKLVHEASTVPDKTLVQEAAHLVEAMEYLQLEEVQAVAEDIVPEPVKSAGSMMELMDEILGDNTEDTSNSASGS